MANTWSDTLIVSLDDAKRHLRLSGGSEDEDLQLKLDQAHALVLDHIAPFEDTDAVAAMQAWDSETTPPPVVAAILRQLGELYRLRGDDNPTELARQDADLSAYVRMFLARHRTRTIA